MYNKLFAKILDSSIWLEPNADRLVWITLLAAMDEDGFAQFAAVANLAHRARVTVQEAEEAVRKFEGPDPESGDPDNEGRRIERIPGGWLVLNAKKHRDLISREVAKEKTRERVARHRAKKACNGGVTECNVSVTPSEAEAEANAEAETHKRGNGAAAPTPPRGKRAKPTKTPIPDDFGMTPERLAYIEANLPDADPEALVVDYCGKAKAKGWVYADWSRAFQTYVREAHADSGHWTAGQYRRKAVAGRRLRTADEIEAEERARAIQ